jgi:predicted nucleic acid-binding protein
VYDLTRGSRSGSIAEADAAAAIALFRHDFLNKYIITEITSSLINRGMQLAETHALRGYDSVQLAAALEINGQRLSSGMPKLILVSADGELNSAAMAEGLIVDDLNAHA